MTAVLERQPQQSDIIARFRLEPRRKLAVNPTPLGRGQLTHGRLANEIMREGKRDAILDDDPTLQKWLGCTINPARLPCLQVGKIAKAHRSTSNRQNAEQRDRISAQTAEASAHQAACG